MNKLSIDERTRIVAALVEGNSMRAVSRMTGVARNTVYKLLVGLGAACSKFQDKTLRDLSCKRFRCDEIWSFVGAKEKNTSSDKKAEGWGDVWTWVAMDPDTKLVATWFVGERHAGAAYHFIHDLKARLANRLQLTTDGHKAYFSTVEDACGTEVDYAQLIKIYGKTPEGAEVRYSPADCMETKKAVITSNPAWEHISTSLIEPQNLTMQMQRRRFTRLTDAFSNKVGKHEHMLALHYMFYNFGRIHQSLSVTPAMEAAIADHVWSLEEIIALLD